MPKVTLVEGKRLMIGGRTFERDVETDVPYDVADALKNHAKFEVNFSDEPRKAKKSKVDNKSPAEAAEDAKAAALEAEAKRPKALKARAEAVAVVLRALGSNGRTLPSTTTLSQRLGWTVQGEDRRAAADLILSGAPVAAKPKAKITITRKAKPTEEPKADKTKDKKVKVQKPEGDNAPKPHLEPAEDVGDEDDEDGVKPPVETPIDMD